MLDLDAVVDLDTPAYDLDGNPVGTPTVPVAVPGGHGRKPKIAPFVPRKEWIVGHAIAILGPFEAHAHAVIVHDGTAHTKTRSRAGAKATRTVLSRAASDSRLAACSTADRTVVADTAARLAAPTFRSDAARTVLAYGQTFYEPEARADATITHIGMAATRCDCTAEGSAFVTLDIRAEEDELLLLL